MLRPDLPWEKACIEAAHVRGAWRTPLHVLCRAYNNEPQQIGVAVSDDGIAWTRLSDEPLLPDGAPGSWNESESGHPGVFRGRRWPRHTCSFRATMIAAKVGICRVCGCAGPRAACHIWKREARDDAGDDRSHPQPRASARRRSFFLAFLLIALLVATGITRRLDETVIRAAHAIVLVVPIDLSAPSRSWGFQARIVAAAAVIVLLARRYRLEATFLLIGLLGSDLSVLLIKELFRRLRPDFFPDATRLTSYSFPSGHATTSLVFYTLFGLLVTISLPKRRARIIRWAFLALALLIGAARIVEGVHWPMDVLGGFCWGTGWLLIVRAWYLHTRWFRAAGPFGGLWSDAPGAPGDTQDTTGGP